jgi:cytosine/adenosine deaminase-related metal-dependent hydrolase
MTTPANAIAVRGGLLFDPGADEPGPRAMDMLILGDRIAEIVAPGAPFAAALPATVDEIDARDRLVTPGFVNAHYHSYDVLAKGLLEDMPFDVWALHSQPAYYGPRSRAELRMRVLLGAIEALRNGITAVQDMNTLVPQDEETLDVILAAYAEVGIRVTFSIALRDRGELDIAPFLPADTPPEVLRHIAGADRDPLPDLAFVERQLARRADLPDRIRWALSPSGPQRCSTVLLEGLADLSRRRALPLFTHVYETRAQTAKARTLYADDGGSMIAYLDRLGLLSPRTTLAHCVWLGEAEMARLAERGVTVAHNPISNMKLKSGVAPMRALKCEGVSVALGCDNSSCGDCQNMFQAMKAYCLLAAVADAEPTGIAALDALQAATIGGARALGLAEEIGRLAPGMKADLVLIDLADPAYMPFNDAARQLVFSESGRGVETVIVDGRVVVRDRRLTTLDERALREELIEIMARFRRDFATLSALNRAAEPYLLQANRNTLALDLGVERHLQRRRP